MLGLSGLQKPWKHIGEAPSLFSGDPYWTEGALRLCVQIQTVFTDPKGT